MASSVGLFFHFIFTWLSWTVPLANIPFSNSLLGTTSASICTLVDGFATQDVFLVLSLAMAHETRDEFWLVYEAEAEKQPVPFT